VSKQGASSGRSAGRPPKTIMTFTEHLFNKNKGIQPSYMILPGGQAVRTYEDPLEQLMCCPLIDPQVSPYAEKWDMVITTALLVTALWTPYEVAFVTADAVSSGRAGFKFVVDRILDCIFVKDMVLQFMMSYPEEREGTTRWVRDRTKIVFHYLSGWFAIDLVAVLPFDLIVSATSLGSGESMKDIKVIRLVRLFRLVKIGRIVKKWQAAWGVSYGQVALMKFFFMTVLAVHWMSCIWGLIALQKQESTPHERTWLTCLFSNKGLTDEERVFYSQPHRVYIMSLYWAVMTLTSLGYGDIVAENLTEYCFCVFCFVASGLIWAYVIGSICGIISAMDPLLVQYQQNMDLLNIMMADNNLPEDMRRRLRHYFQESRNLQRKVNQQHVVNSLSPGLQGELAMKVTQESLNRVWYLGFAESEPVIEISKRLKPMIFASRETLALNNASRTLFIVCRGVVARDGMILGKDSVVGDDMIISSNTLRATARAICVTFIEVIYFRNEQLDEVREAFPSADERVRRAQVRWAVRRGFVLAAWHRMQQKNGIAGPRATDYFLREVPSFTTREEAETWSFAATPRGSLGEIGCAVKRRQGKNTTLRRSSTLQMQSPTVGLPKLLPYGSGSGGDSATASPAVGRPPLPSAPQFSLAASLAAAAAAGGASPLASGSDVASVAGAPGAAASGTDVSMLVGVLEQLRQDVNEGLSRLETRLERVERRVNPGFLS